MTAAQPSAPEPSSRRPESEAARFVLDMRDRRPIWSIPEWAVEEIRGALRPGWELVVVETPTDGSGDGAGGPSAEAIRAVADARAYAGFGIPPQIVKAGENLEWVHTGTAGVGSSITPELRRSGAVLTNSAGVYGPPMAETVVGMILHFARGFDRAVGGQWRGIWDPEPFRKRNPAVREVAGSTVGLVGFGGIGREVHRRVRALGARVLALKRTPCEAPDEGTEVLTGSEAFPRLLEESDYLVLTAPATGETRSLVDASALERMKPGAVLVNVARGSLVDQEALVEALRSGRLRGAGLDVFQHEPLPEGDPLWDLENVLITPHVSGATPDFWWRQTDLIVENLNRWFSGRPLRNQVDLDAGY